MKIILVAGAVLSLGQISQGCAIMSPEMQQDTSISTTDEAALIVWDEKTKTEHFIRRASFSGATKEFGFMVPTPSKPSLGETKEGLFEALEEEVKPEIKTQIDREYRFFAFFGNSGEEFESAATSTPKAEAAGDEDVQVIEQTRVGDYDATVLRADDAKALGEWLRKNSYTATPSVEKWLQFYTDKKWYLTAFKVRANRENQNASLAPVRISFETAKPFYPYHEPETAQKNPIERSLRVFFVGEKRTGADVVSPAKSEKWAGETTYSSNLKNSSGIEELGGLPTGQKLEANGKRLTTFVDYSTPRRGFGDLYFSPSDEQREILPEPIINHKEQTIFIPLDLIGLVLLGIFAYRRFQPSESRE